MTQPIEDAFSLIASIVHAEHHGIHVMLARIEAGNGPSVALHK